MSDIEARLRALEDRAAIEALLVEIASAIDRHDGARLTTLIAADAVIDMGGDAPLTGAAFAAAIRPPAAPRPGRMHVISNVRLVLDGDAARSEAQIVSWQDQAGDDGAVTRVRAGRYLDAFRRDRDGWLLTARTMIDEWGRIDPVEAVPPLGRHRGMPVPADPSSAHLKGS